jgi:hypothetical protein
MNSAYEEFRKEQTGARNPIGRYFLSGSESPEKTLRDGKSNNVKQ